MTDGERVMPEPMLVGRNADKLEALAEPHGGLRWTTDLDAALANPRQLRSTSTRRRRDRAPTLLEQGDRRRQAHLLREADRHRPRRRRCDLPRCAKKAGVKHGVVQDKLWLPGLLKLQDAARLGLLRPHPLGARRVRLLGVRGRLAAGAAAVVELPQGRRRRHHHRHALPLALRARQPVRQREGGVVPRRHAHPERVDEAGKPLRGTADDAAYATFELEGGIIAHFNSSWCDARAPRRPADASRSTARTGSAVAGLRDCWIQPHAATPQAGLESRHEADHRLLRQLAEGAGQHASRQRASRPSGSCSCATSSKDEPFRWSLLEGAKGVQLAELGLRELGRTALGSTFRRSTTERRPHVDHRAACPPPTARSPPTRCPTQRLAAIAAHATAGIASRSPPRTSSPIRAPTSIPWLAGGDRLGRDARLSPLPVGLGPRRRRGDGHRAARHGARLADVAGADPPLGRRAARRARAPSCSPAPAPIISTRPRRAPSTT